MMDFRALGRLSVFDGGDELPIGGPRQRRLLAVLLEHRNAVVSSDRIAEAVFVGEPTARAAATLRTYVSRLRRDLGDGSAETLITRPPGYLLVVDDAGFDVTRFERTARDGQRLLQRGDAHGAASRLESALAIWRGDAYAEFAEEPWIQPEAQRLEEARLDALGDLNDADLACGTTHVLGRLERLTVEHPLRERFRAQLVVALYRCGRQVDALRAVDEYRTVLADELGLNLPPELTELERRILDHDPELRAVDSGGAVRGYRLGASLGAGSAGTVVAAGLPGEPRALAIRVYRSEVADRAEFVRTFDADAERLATVDHPAIVPVVDHWREPGAAYLVMERMSGGTLADRLQRGRIDVATLARLVAQVGAALAAADAQGLRPRRLDTRSVLLDADGGCRIADFAIGCDTTEGVDPVAALAELTRACLAAADRWSPSVESGKAARALIERRTPPCEASGTSVGEYAARLAEAIGGLASRPVGSPRNPYKGLRAFDEADAADFFGRRRVIDELTARLASTEVSGRFLLLVGASGSGKSSCVRAGLVPALRAGAVPGSDRWMVTTMLPGGEPFKELAEAIRRVAVRTTDTVVEDLARDEAGIEAVLDATLPPKSELLLVVDQLEELFTLSRRPDQQRFVEGLLHAVASPSRHLRVVATLRADFYDRPLQLRGLGELADRSTVSIPPMTAAELERAITGPAAETGLSVEEGLVAELVATVVDEPGALPALQFALFELAELRGGDRLTLAAYRELGGLEGAIATRAERLYRSLDDADRRGVRDIFERLVTIADDDQPVRARVLASELTATDDGRARLLEQFIEARLLTTGRDPASRQPTVEVVHEALLRDWPRLAAWLTEDRDDLRRLARLRVAAGDWDALGRDPGALYRGLTLDAVLPVARRHEELLAPIDLEFLTVSRDVQEHARREERDRHAHQVRMNRRLRTLVGAFGVALLVALVSALIAFGQRGDARNARASALDSAGRSDAARLRAAAENLAEKDQRASLLLAVEAHRRDPSAASRGALLQALTARDGFLGFVGTNTRAADGSAVAFGSDGEIVTATSHEIEVYSPSGRRRTGRIARGIPRGPRPRASLLSAAPDRSEIAIVDGDGVQLFDIEQMTPTRRLRPTGQPSGLWFAPSGELLVATTTDRLEAFGPDGAPRPELPVGTRVVDVAFDRAGTIAVTASGSADGLRVWDLATRNLIATPSNARVPRTLLTLPELDFGPFAVALSPDDQQLAAAFQDGHVGIWDTATWAPTRRTASGAPLMLQDPGSVLQDVEFLDTSPPRVAALGLNQYAEWSLVEGLEAAVERDPAVPIVRRAAETGRNISVDPDTQRLLTGAATVQLWSTDDTGLLTTPLGRAAFGHLSASPDGRTIVKQSSESGHLDEIWQYDRDTGKERKILDDALWGATLSPDGRFIVDSGPSAEDVGRSRLQLRDARTLDMIGPPLDVPGGPQQRDFAPEGRFLAIGFGAKYDAQLVPPLATDGQVEIYEITAAGLRRTARIPEFSEMLGTDYLAKVVMSPDGRRLLAEGGNVKAEWSVPDGRLLRGPTRLGDLIPGWPMGRMRTTARYAWRTGDGRIELVDAGHLRSQGGPFLGDDGVQDIAGFSADDRLMFTGGFHMGWGLVTVWDVPARTRLGRQLTNRAWEDASGMGVSPLVLGDGRDDVELVTTTPRRLVAWNFETETWPAIACAAAGRNLTRAEWRRFGPDAPYRATCSRWAPDAS